MKFPTSTVRTGLAGAATLAAATSSYADIVSVAPPTNIITAVGVGAGAPILSWDVNGDSVIDFQFVFRYYSGSSWQALMSASTTSNVLGDPTVFSPLAAYARSYGAGAPVAPGNPAFTGSGINAIILGSLYNGSLYGGFAGGGNLNSPRFAGFRFDIAGQTHYGYLQARVNADGANGTITFLSAAFESTPNTAILTGVTAVPEPGTTLAALVAGGLTALQIARRRKQARAALPTAA